MREEAATELGKLSSRGRYPAIVLATLGEREQALEQLELEKA